MAMELFPEAALPQVRLDQLLRKKAEAMGVDVEDLKSVPEEDVEST
jgi:hypothetical protein